MKVKIGGFLVIAVVLVVVGTFVRNAIDDSLAEGPRTLHTVGEGGSAMVFDRGTQVYDVVLAHLKKEGMEEVDGKYQVSALEFVMILALFPRDSVDWITPTPKADVAN